MNELSNRLKTLTLAVMDDLIALRLKREAQSKRRVEIMRRKVWGRDALILAGYGHAEVIEMLRPHKRVVDDCGMIWTCVPKRSRSFIF